MSKFEGTAGEWKQQGFRIYTGDIKDGISRSIADCNFTRIRKNGMRMTAAEFTEAEANVNLFLAARDLLTALQQIVADWESVDPNAQVPDEINTDEHWDAARAAIRKALGEPTP